MDVLCSQWNFGSCPFMILVLLLNSYAVWKSNWYFHINFGQICEQFWQLLKLLKMASPRMEDIPSGIDKTGDLSPPTLKQGWILSTMGGNEPVWCHNIVGGYGSEGMKRWTQSRSKNNLVVTSRVLCNNYLEGFFRCVPISFDLHCSQVL